MLIYLHSLFLFKNHLDGNCQHLTYPTESFGLLPGNSIFWPVFYKMWSLGSLDHTPEREKAIKLYIILNFEM